MELDNNQARALYAVTNASVPAASGKRRSMSMLQSKLLHKQLTSSLHRSIFNRDNHPRRVRVDTARFPFDGYGRVAVQHYRSLWLRDANVFRSQCIAVRTVTHRRKFDGDLAIGRRCAGNRKRRFVSRKTR